VPRHVLAFIVLVQLAAAPAVAAGINAYWNNCGPGNPTFRSFACNTNFGTHDIVASFVPPEGLTKVVGAIGIVDLCLGGVNLSPWWQYDAGSCRETALRAVAQDVSLPSNCVDYWQGQANFWIDYQVGYSGWDSARLVVSVGLQSQFAGPVEPGVEYHAFTVRIGNTATVGPGACFGCLQPACIVLNEIQLLQPAGTPGGSPALTVPDSNNYLMWQNYVSNCPFIVPVANRTWGQVKSLYR
jgi:hypothetical protein